MMNYDEFKQTLTTNLNGEKISIAYHLKGDTDKSLTRENCYGIKQELISKELNLDKVELFATNKNNVNLEQLPHILFQDIAIHMKYVIARDEFVSCTALMTQEFMRYFGVTWDQIFSRAFLNTFMRKWTITDMVDVFTDASVEGMEGIEAMPDTERGCIYVVRFEDNPNHGGILFTNPLVLERVYEQVGGFYLIGSSIHEFLVIPGEVSDTYADYWKDTILNINSTEVEESEVLSNHLYYFNGEVLKVLR